MSSIFDKLPSEILFEITKYAPIHTLANLCATCYRFRAIFEPSLYALGAKLASSVMDHSCNPAAWAVDNVQPTTLRKLLSSGLSPNIKVTGPRHGWSSVSLLHLSVESPRLRHSANTSITKLLLDHGAWVDIRDGSNATPLHWAALYGGLGEPETAPWMHLLLNYGADVNAEDRAGFTPLHTATMARNTLGIQVLVYHNANKDATNMWGHTPMLMAVNSKYAAGIKILLEAGAVSTSIEEDSNLNTTSNPASRRIRRYCVVS
ncbi:ankyrin repeat-containing domain protein [Pyronema omphalodes]|nr:ankyrin repeat-containing domain protein [Pyronema omphalodes]